MMLNALLPVFITLLIGYLAAWRYDAAGKTATTLNNLVMTFTLPLSLFAGTVTISRDQLVQNLPMMTALFVGLVVPFAQTPTISLPIAASTFGRLIAIPGLALVLPLCGIVGKARSESVVALAMPCAVMLRDSSTRLSHRTTDELDRRSDLIRVRSGLPTLARPASKGTILAFPLLFHSHYFRLSDAPHGGWPPSFPRIYSEFTMRIDSTPTLVLMRASEEDGRALFAGDLYLGRSLEGSVYHTRTAMLDWLGSADTEARSAAAQAMDQLAASPDTILRAIPLNSLPVPVHA